MLEGWRFSCRCRALCAANRPQFVADAKLARPAQIPPKHSSSSAAYSVLRTAHLSFAGTERVFDLRSSAVGRITSGAIAE